MSAPFQVYLHVPFCRRKCGYCAFYSEAPAAPARVAAYLARLEEELAAFPFPGRAESLYFGGGTPSLLDERELERLFAVVRKRVPLADGAEISLEANPETLTPSKLRLIRELATRLSVGVQSFDAERRRRLGRDCSDAAIGRALDGAAEAGFAHLNCDLIYAGPDQTPDAWVRDLRRSLAYRIDHLSCYSLTVEEGTRLAADGRTVVDDETSAAMWEAAGSVLAEAGFRRYEISNYARPGGECRHNLAVWRGSRLYGFGPSAASYDGTVRLLAAPELGRWLAGEPLERDELPPDARRREIAVVNLRTADGWRRAEFLALPGADAGQWAALTAAAEALSRRCPGCIDVSDAALRLTDRGMLFWNEIASELL